MTPIHPAALEGFSQGADAYAHYALGVVLSLMGRSAQAEAEQRHALELNPYLAVAAGELSRLHAFAGRFDEAMAEADRAIAASPNDPHAWLWHRAKAIACFVAGRHAQAVEHATDACARLGFGVDQKNPRSFACRLARKFGFKPGDPGDLEMCLRAAGHGRDDVDVIGHADCVQVAGAIAAHLHIRAPDCGD